jgi:adenosylcobinamide hydrolase
VPASQLGAGVSLLLRHEHSRSWPVLGWRAPAGWRSIASSVVGGGLAECHWWVNSMVPREYHRQDPDRHVLEIAAELGLPAELPGVGMLTATDVSAVRFGQDGGVRAWATVGLGWPVWAAAGEQQAAAEQDQRQPASVTAPPTAPSSPPGPPPPGTINLLITVPTALADAALVNAVITATEAKTQALVQAGVNGSGTSSDAICIACPLPEPGTEPELYGGPRSVWGARLARAVHTAVADGTAQWLRTQLRADQAALPVRTVGPDA